MYDCNKYESIMDKQFLLWQKQEKNSVSYSIFCNQIHLQDMQETNCSAVIWYKTDSDQRRAMVIGYL